MGTLKDAHPNARELVTEIIDMTRWWSTLGLIVEFLQSKRVVTVRVEYGTVLDRDLAGKLQTQSRTVKLSDLAEVIKEGFEDGEIEWAKTSDFLFHPLGTDLAFMLCNDADVHFASSDLSLLMELGRTIRDSGVKVYDSGNSSRSVCRLRMFRYRGVCFLKIARQFIGGLVPKKHCRPGRDG